MRGRRARAALGSIACGAALTFLPAAGAAHGPNSSATITGVFGADCRAFTAHSNKDISYVQLRYADGRVTKDEHTTTPDYVFDAGPGQALASATVKSGRTVETFTCTPANGRPAAVLEILTPDDAACTLFFESGLHCDQHAVRSVWRSSGDLPTEAAPPEGSTKEAGHLLWGCDATPGPCPFTFTFRGTSSTDPDGDLASWSLDFGDGTSASGTWTGDPPAAAAHAYGAPCLAEPYCVVTLTVGDAAGHSASDAITMAFIDETPD